MDLIALGVPWLLLTIIAVIIVMSIFRHKKTVIVLSLLALAGSCYFRVFPLNLSNNSQGELKVLSFNCNLSPKGEDLEERSRSVVDLIDSISPDVLFLTENFYKVNDPIWDEIIETYPYASEPVFCVGNKVYSKYPIQVDSVFNDTHMAYGINYCRIDYSGSPIDVFGIHLSSNNYNESMEYMTPDSVSTRHQARIYLNNIVKAGEYREGEASMMRDVIDCQSGSVPVIVMGDFNDVCGSPTLKVLESVGLKDAWWEGGFGYGATIHDPLPFRIDHIMYNDRLILKSIKKVDAKGLSDHDALVARFLFKKY